MASVSTAYISASTNRHSHAADAKDSLVAFGSSTYVALWNSADTCGRGTYATLPGHEGLVTCVHFVSNDSFVSTDDRGVLKFWREIGTQWVNTVTVSAHSAAISTLAVCGDVLVTGASDSFVKIWKLTCKPEQDELIESQSISLKGKFPLALQLATLPRSQVLILAVGGTDRNVNIWTCSEDVFVPSITLPGHEDWVKSLAFKTLDSEDLSLTLASGSQDGTIRLWKIDPYQRQATQQSTIDALSDDLLDTFEESLGELADAEEGGRQISLKRHILTVKDNEGTQKQYTVTFDALLIGHEAGVTSLSWRPRSSTYSEPTLLSTSADSSLILWSPSTILGSTQDGSTSLWINRHRFGDIGGQRLGGFVGGLWAQDGQEALGWGWSGGWRRWQCSSPQEPATGTIEDWVEVGAICGHSAPVKGLAWSPDGDFLISSR
ncbi:hypothetical protein PHLCEN_2v10603 [Hermanssonia centrifuga]|uniref:Elongator complex protein 2 n=1 Tax=Hermanssonia centrifuga TaxID=98765 RepID=A0A2R6NMR8_9APHY|nr:hypothetical protein PHLCEN_2v10603 [Hermanssonia centrifuga]